MGSNLRNCRLRHMFVLVSLLASVYLVSGCVKPDVVVPPGPPPEGFLLGPEDVIEVVVWRNPDLSGQAVIRPDGKVSLPLIGDVQASGVTADQLAKDISNRYKEYKENPAVSINVVEVNSYYVYVVGEVTTPGKIPLKSYTTILQGIALAGGFTQFAARNDLSVVRNVSNGDGKAT